MQYLQSWLLPCANLLQYGLPLEKYDCSQVLDRTGMISIPKKLFKGNPERPY